MHSGWWHPECFPGSITAPCKAAVPLRRATGRQFRKKASKLKRQSMTATPVQAGAKLLTLVLVHDGEKILLGRKKRGFGEGYYNGFGGKVEPGETVEEAAHRELTEECGICCDALVRIGILWFSFDDNPQPWEVHVFHSPTFRGTPTETDEMAPEWFALSDIPFEKMWADDVHWYPMMLQGQSFKGLFLYQNTHNLVKHHLVEVKGDDWGPLEKEFRDFDALDA